jgi:hypothetical protein
MSETTASKLKRRSRNQALGTCTNATSHGSAVRLGFCAACADAHDAMAKKVRAQRKALGLCANAPSHGPATVGATCEACAIKRRKGIQAYRKRRKASCAFGASHGPAVSGVWCKVCIEGKRVAAARMATRSATIKPEMLRLNAQPKPRKETVKERITRGKCIDSSGLWDLLWGIES